MRLPGTGRVPAHRSPQSLWAHYLNYRPELLVGQFAGRGAGQPVWDVNGLHGCHIGWEV